MDRTCVLSMKRSQCPLLLYSAILGLSPLLSWFNLWLLVHTVTDATEQCLHPFTLSHQWQSFSGSPPLSILSGRVQISWTHTGYFFSQSIGHFHTTFFSQKCTKAESFQESKVMEIYGWSRLSLCRFQHILLMLACKWCFTHLKKFIT